MTNRSTTKDEPAAYNPRPDPVPQGRACPDDRWAPLLERVAFQPVFIMGDHRTGTTLLYQVLAQTGLFNYASSYHIIKFDEILDHHMRGTDVQARSDLAAC